MIRLRLCRIGSPTLSLQQFVVTLVGLAHRIFEQAVKPFELTIVMLVLLIATIFMHGASLLAQVDHLLDLVQKACRGYDADIRHLFGDVEYEAVFQTLLLVISTLNRLISEAGHPVPLSLETPKLQRLCNELVTDLELKGFVLVHDGCQHGARGGKHPSLLLLELSKRGSRADINFLVARGFPSPTPRGWRGRFVPA